MNKVSIKEYAKIILSSPYLHTPWVNSVQHFSLDPFSFPQNELLRLQQAAEAIGEVYEELRTILINNPADIESYFSLTPYQQFLWMSSLGEWHGIARLDMFITENNSIQIAEMNSDTPSSLEEAVYLNTVVSKLNQDTSLQDCNATMTDDFVSMVTTSFRSTYQQKKQTNTSVAAIIYPTEIPEDMGLIELYADLLKSIGFTVFVGSPFNIGYSEAGKVTVFGNEIDLLFRHYKTDWWTERLSAWTDEEEIPDSKPLEKQLRWIVKASIEQKLCVVNPMGAIVSQNKHSMAYCWERLEQFSEKSQEIITSFIPKTHRFESMQLSVLFQEKERWVLKSIYGCEGAEVIIGAFTKQEEWERSIQALVPNQWIVQEFFLVKPLPDGSLPNFGMYLIGGKATGILLRISNANASTDLSSKTVPIFVKL